MRGLLLGLMAAGTAAAHPLGNTTVNRQAQIAVGPKQVELTYLLELAEIPTLLAGQEADSNGDGVVAAEEWQAYASHWAQGLLPQLTLSVGGRPLPLALKHREYQLEAGAAGLQQLRLEAHYTGEHKRAQQHFTLDYRDASRLQERGWREIWLHAAPGLRVVAADVPQRDRSDRLRHFPLDQGELPDELAAHLELALADAPPAALPASPAPRPTSDPAPDAPSPAADSPPAPAVTDAALPTSPSAAASPAAASPAAAPPPAAPPPAPSVGAFAFFLLGIHHIASGWDHLVFLLGLVLVASGLGQLIRIVTAFTLAHSLTLAAAATGLVHLPEALVEPAIALTIAYVGLANLLWRKNAHGTAVAFGFGQIHGFGFAGALAASLAATPPASASWLLDLAAFNLGIEAFQLALLALALPLLRALEPCGWAAPTRHVLAFGILLTGSCSFILRLGSPS